MNYLIFFLAIFFAQSTSRPAPKPSMEFRCPVKDCPAFGPGYTGTLGKPAPKPKPRHPARKYVRPDFARHAYGDFGCTPDGCGGTEQSGTLNTDGTWTAPDLPYTYSAAVQVDHNWVAYTDSKGHLTVLDPDGELACVFGPLEESVEGRLKGFSYVCIEKQHKEER